MKKINQGNASYRAYDFIKGMITKNQWIPGQKITYQELAEKIKMSNTPIINALNRLEQEEFVISVQNRGFFVREITDKDVEELYNIRKSLELLSIEESIRNFNPSKLLEIEKAMINHRNYDYSKPTRYRWELDIGFHLKIAEMGLNMQLKKILKYICELNYMRIRIEGYSIKRMAETVNEHQKIFDAIKNKNIIEARRQMIKHLNRGKCHTIEEVLHGNRDI